MVENCEGEFMNHSDYLLNLINAYKVSNALFVAAEYKVFDFVEQESSIDTIAEASGLDPEALEIILQVFCARKLLKQETDRTFTLEDSWKKLLDSRSKTSMIPLMKLEGFLSERHNTKRAMEFVLRSGRGKDALNENGKEGRAEVYGQAMEAGGQFSSVCIAREFRKLAGGRILDVGGGAGTHAVQICQYNPKVQIDIIDKPEMQAVCMNKIREAGLETRIRFQAGDIFKTDIDQYEGILISNVLHLFRRDLNKQLLHKLASSLKNSGLILIHDFILDEAHIHDSAAVDSTLDWMLLGSMFHADALELKRWLEEIPLMDVKVKRFREIPTSIITARKPAE